MGTTFYDLLYEYFDWIAGVIVVGGLMLAGASLIGLLAVGLAVVVPWRRGGVPRCGKCGYPVTGVAGWTCPECGSDYRSMGIIAPHHRRLVHPLVTVPLFSFFLAAPATMVAVVAIAVGPTTATYTDNVDLVPKADAGYEQIQLYAHSARGGAKHTAERIDIHIETEPSWYIYEVDYGSMTYVEQDAAIMGTPGLPFSRAGLEQMYVDAGVDITKPEFIKGIDEIWPIIQDAPSIGLHRTQVDLFEITYNDTWTDEGPAVWWMVVVGVLCAAVWLVGVVGIVALHMARAGRKGKPAPAFG